MMEQLGIGEGAESMASAAPVKPVKPKKAPVKRAPKVKEEPQPRRSSSRVAGLILDDSELKRKREVSRSLHARTTIADRPRTKRLRMLPLP